MAEHQPPSEVVTVGVVLTLIVAGDTPSDLARATVGFALSEVIRTNLAGNTVELVGMAGGVEVALSATVADVRIAEVTP